MKYLMLVLLVGCLCKLHGRSFAMDAAEPMMVIPQDTLGNHTGSKTKENVNQKKAGTGDKIVQAADKAIKKVPKARNRIVPKTAGPVKVRVATPRSAVPVKVRVKVKPKGKIKL